ncbi:MAG: hypothetical protein IT204_13215 [Fimbriimonadaceae bacterium]|nr:hypothetical protein [Fimbriimonadaceae bacterium]
MLGREVQRSGGRAGLRALLVLLLVGGSAQAQAGLINRAQSTVVLSGNRLAADNTAVLQIFVTLLDSNADPVMNIPGSNFRVTSTTDIGLTTVMENSNNIGLSRGTLRCSRPGTGSLRVEVLDPGLNQFVLLRDPLTDAQPLAITALPIFDLLLQPGLNLVTSPLTVDDPAAQTVWAPTAPIRVARYLPQTNRYVGFQITQPDTAFDVTIGRAWWVQVNALTRVRLAGVAWPSSGNPALDATYSYPVRLSGYDWTLAGIPAVTALEWDEDALQVTVNDLVLGTLGDADEFVSPYGWIWNAGQQQAQLVIDSSYGIRGSTDTIPAGSGFWLHKGTSTLGTGQVSLVFNTRTMARSQQLPASGWSLNLQATSAGQPTATAVVGVHSRLGRALDIAPAPFPSADGLRLAVLDTTGRPLAGRLDPILAGGGSWRLQVSTSGVASPVTLSWPDAGRVLPDHTRAVLTDLTTGQAVSLRSGAALSFTPAADGTRDFALQVTPDTGQRLTVGLQAGASRGRAISATLTLNAPARVTVRVLGLSGRVVKVWNVQAPAGVSSIAWDGLDSAGRRAPAGTYRLEVVAIDSVGEAATASTVLPVR